MTLSNCFVAKKEMFICDIIVLYAFLWGYSYAITNTIRRKLNYVKSFQSTRN